MNGIWEPELGESDPRRADTDGDGIPDGVEDANRNGCYEPQLGETSATRADSDGDGVADGAEDANRNGVFEPHLGESDPRRTDTDGDGQSDGSELLASTDPNDPEGRSSIDDIRWHSGLGRFVLGWRGRGGNRRYSLMARPSVDATQSVAVADMLLEGGVPPWYLVTDGKFLALTVVSQSFFHVEIKVDK